MAKLGRPPKEPGRTKKATSLNKERVDTDPAFAGSRVASKALKLGGIYAGVIRRAFFDLLKNNSDTRVTSRLSGRMMKIIMQDKAGYPDEQKLLPELLPQLVGFETNKLLSFSAIMPAHITTSWNRQTGEWKATIPAIETGAINAPAGAEYFKLSVGVGAMDFEALKGSADVQETEWIALKAHKEAQRQLSFQLSGTGNVPVIGIVTMSFAGESTGGDYPIFDKSFNAGMVVSVDVVG